jgi:AcrR family transcriptional regulator
MIDGTIKVFREKRYHKATGREIAEEAKISPRSIYDYFSSKDDILISLFEELEHLNLCSDDPTEWPEIAYRVVLEVLLELQEQVMPAYTQARYKRKNDLDKLRKANVHTSE